MESADLSSVLADLAAGRIDTAEASRRIEALQGGNGPHGSASPRQETTPPGPPAGADADTDAEQPPQKDGASSAETWASNETLQSAGDLLRGVFRTARSAAEAAASRVRPESGSAGAAAHEASESADRTTPQAATGRPTDGVERVSVRATGRRVRIVVDPSVTHCHVTGEHTLRRVGPVIEVTAEGDFHPHIDGLKLFPPPRSFGDLRLGGKDKDLLIRMQPGLLLDVEVTAGGLQISNVPRLGRVRFTAGSAKITGFSEVDDALIQAAVVQMSGTIRTGRSRIRVESGQLSLKLDPASNVTVVGDASLGKVTWSGQHHGSGDQVVMGNGSARLDVGVVMGHAGVQIGDEVRAAG